MERIRWTLLAWTLAFGSTSCSEVYDNVVGTVPCVGGNGELRLVETVWTNGPAPETYRFELHWIRGGTTRVVDVLRVDLTPYREPLPDEGYVEWRPASQTASQPSWPVFVSPREFTRDELEIIRDTLARGRAALDAAAAEPRPPERFFSDRRVPRVSSLRYLDLSALERSYRGPAAGERIEVGADGRITFFHARGDAWVGRVVGNGERALLRGAEWLPGRYDLPRALADCRAENGRSLGDDFAVELLDTKGFYARLIEAK